MCKYTDDTIKNVTPRGGDSAKKRRLSEEDLLTLSRDIFADDEPVSHASGECPLDDLPGADVPFEADASAFFMEPLADSLPPSPISPVRRRSSGSVCALEIAEPVKAPVAALRQDESAMVATAQGRRPEFRTAKRSSTTTPTPPKVLAPMAMPCSSQCSLALPTEEPHVGPRSDPRRYVVGQLLGEGAAGQVREATSRDSHTKLAVKTVPYGSATMEAAAMTACGAHPHVVGLIDQFELDGESHLVTPLAEGGDLLQHLQSHGPFPEAQAKKHAAALLDALSSVHKAGWCHRDVKLENLLLQDGQLLLADFGSAAPITAQPEQDPRGQHSKTRRLWDAVGSPSYMAPEVVQASHYGSSYDGAQADLFSVGVVLYAMLVGCFPWQIASMDHEGFASFVAGHHVWPSHLSSDAVALLEALMAPADRRHSITQARQHPWLAAQ